MARKTPWRGVLKEFREYLPITPATPALTLFEGNTPLVPAYKNLLQEIEFDGKLYFKDEGRNPTGSFKDRGMVVAVAKALETGSEAIICASTGNTAASAAAYAARARIQAIVVLPAGKVAAGKLAQALMYGASVIEVQGNFDDALRVVREIAGNYNVALVNSVNPYRLEGQKTAAFEISDVLQQIPEFHFIPVGNAGNITAYWKGYKEWAQDKYIVLPRMMGYQAEGASPIVHGRVIENPETIASAIRIGNPARWQEAKRAVAESSGHFGTVTDADILEAYKLLARYEGIFCEPSSAAAFAGFMKAKRQGLVPSDALVVCTLTGNGLKDPDTAVSVSPAVYCYAPESDAIAAALKLERK